MTITDGVRGYIAGIIDGEGTPRLTTRTFSDGRVRTWPAITVGSTDIPMLEKLQEWCGGTLLQTGAPPCARPCDKQHVHKNYQAHRLTIKGLRAMIVVEGVLPWLIIKREPALQLLSWRPKTETGFKVVRADMGKRGWFTQV